MPRPVTPPRVLAPALVLALALALPLALVPSAGSLRASDVKTTDVYARLARHLDAVSAINTHDHLMPFDRIGPRDRVGEESVITLRSIWAGSYFPWIHSLSPWPEDGSFDTWWARARGDFDNARATSFYRYLLPAFRDLYGVDFDTVTAEEARDLNRRIVENYRSPSWLHDVITERARVELMVVDPYWARLDYTVHYRFTVPLCNVTSLVRGFHPSEFRNPLDDPYAVARRLGLEIRSLDDYVALLDRILAEAKAAGAVCLKSTLAYNRTLSFRNVPAARAAAAFGKPRSELTGNQIRSFEDHVMWRLVELAAKHDLPFQIHTGQARIQGSNPMLLVDMIEANPRTRFVLFHGGFPWVGETGVIAMRFRNVWIDSCWLPTLSYSMAKRAYQEWLEAVPSDRILWGSDTGTAEGIYGATVFTRRCLTEALAEKVVRGELREEHAARIGRQILRENALALFPSLRGRLWRGELEPRPGPVPVIFDTDMDTDCDDAGALSMLHALADLGEVRILGTLVSSKYPSSPPCVEAINRYWGRPDLPIGAPRGDGASTHRGSRYARAIAEEFETDLHAGDEVPDAVEVYRRLLSEAPDSSVVIVTVGYVTNLHDLLRSEPDDISPLPGLRLVEEKVRAWVCMGGRYPEERNPRPNGNFKPHPDAAVATARDWPGPIWFSGDGARIQTGRRLRESAPPDHPARRVYELYLKDRPTRSSWDQVALLYAVRPGAPFWRVDARGHNHIFPDGTNQWRREPDDARHRVVAIDPESRGEVEELIDELMARPPAGRATNSDNS